MWMREKSAIESVEHKLHAYQQAQREEEIQREKERKEREEADEQWRQEVRQTEMLVVCGDDCSPMLCFVKL